MNKADRRNLLCVLDWGLGHASRSLALTRALEEAGERVFLASRGRARSFLQRERPDLEVYELPAYDVRYPTKNMPFNVALQLPKWLRTIALERRRTAELVDALRIDRIISDSRFGCYHPTVPSVMLTHQLQPIFNFRPMSWAYIRYLRRFHECWVPDTPDRALSGRLSDPSGYPKVRFIGPLSRLRPLPAGKEKTYRTFSLLSGPEPMRGRLEAILLRELATAPSRHLLVRGVPSAAPAHAHGRVVVRDFADANFLAEHLPLAEYLICRSGYSTLMDIAVANAANKLVLIPTPGQTEQEYLAERWARTRVQGGEPVRAFAQTEIDLSFLR